MRKRILFIALALFVTGSLMAQSDTTSNKKEKGKFGAFMGRLGETATGINMTNEPFIVNPLKSYMEIQLVGAYGNPSNGEVTIVIKVKCKTYDKTARFGASSADGCVAFTKSGKTYTGRQHAYTEINTAKDIWVEAKLDRIKILEVPETVAAFELINMKAGIGQNRGTIELRNIPIQWGVAPE